MKLTRRGFLETAAMSIACGVFATSSAFAGRDHCTRSSLTLGCGKISNVDLSRFYKQVPLKIEKERRSRQQAQKC
ncbi:MAG TPA: hypothetical protein DIW77_05110 [Chromatiaceae bacterium]|jgi:hypothetical protein|nr:hypothetical protein [Chromatiaceae bacterium]